MQPIYLRAALLTVCGVAAGVAAASSNRDGTMVAATIFSAWCLVAAVEVLATARTKGQP